MVLLLLLLLQPGQYLPHQKCIIQIKMVCQVMIMMMIKVCADMMIKVFAGMMRQQTQKIHGRHILHGLRLVLTQHDVVPSNTIRSRTPRARHRSRKMHRDDSSSATSSMVAIDQSCLKHALPMKPLN